MCGIMGIMPVNVTESAIVSRRIRETAIRILTTHLLLNIESRGPDATGLAVMLENKEWLSIKQPVIAKEFTKNTGQTKYSGQEALANYKNAFRIWQRTSETRSPTSIVIGHTRKATVGSEFNADNNHPIIIGPETFTEGENSILGVHNGKLTNYNIIFDKHKNEIDRVGEVDSEAIFQMIRLKFGSEPLTADKMEELDKYLRGEYAVLAMNNDFTKNMGILRRSRPVEIVTIEAGLDLVMIASTVHALDSSIEEYNRIISIFGNIRLPVIKKADVKSIVFADDTAGCIDTSKQVDSIEKCVKKIKIEYPRTVKSKYGEYDEIKTTTNTTSYKTTDHNTHNHYGHHKTANRTIMQNNTALVVDTSTYTETASDEENTQDDAIMSSMPLKRVSCIEVDEQVVVKGHDLIRPEVNDPDYVDSEDEENDEVILTQGPDSESYMALNSIIDAMAVSNENISLTALAQLEFDSNTIIEDIEDASPGALWISDITTKNACVASGLYSQPSESDIEEAVRNAYAHGFGEGIVLGRLIKEEEYDCKKIEDNYDRMDVDHDEGFRIVEDYYAALSQIDTLKHHKTKAVKTVANLKSFAMALLIGNDCVNLCPASDGDQRSDEYGSETYEVEHDIKILGKRINKNFDLDEAVRVLSASRQDIYKVVKLLHEFRDEYGEQSDETNEDEIKVGAV